MEIYKVFLSLPMDGKNEDEIAYIENCWHESNKFDRINILRKKKIGGLNIDSDSNLSGIAKSIVEFDLQVLKSCDGLILDFSFEDHLYIGSICEMVYAHQMNIPVIIYSGYRIFDKRWWLIFHAKQILSSRESCIAHMFGEISLTKESSRRS